MAIAGTYHGIYTNVERVFLEAANSAGDVGSPVANAEFNLNNTGIAAFTGNDSDPNYTWLLSGDAGDYDARFTLSSGTLDSGTAGAWQNLATSRGWGVFANNDLKITTGTVEIRDASTLVVLASGLVSLEANAF